jgi:heptosyltransferase III
VLVLRPGALGDTLLAVPALRALRRGFGPLTLAAHPSAARLLAAVGEVARGLAFDDPALGWLFTGGDVPDECFVGWMGASELSPEASRRARLLAPSRPDGDEHSARYLLRTLTPLGIDLAWDDRPLNVAASFSDEVLVHPGSGSAAKNWPPARFAEVIAALGSPVRLIVGEADTAAATAVEAALGYSLPRLEHPPLADLAARLAGCRAYLGNDSGVSHLAGLCGARTAALFGPTSPTVWRPIGPDVHTLDFEADVDAVVSLLLLPRR